MREDLAAVNVTRTYTLAASNIAIFTFTARASSDLVSDQDALFPKILGSDRLTRSLRSLY